MNLILIILLIFILVFAAGEILVRWFVPLEEGVYYRYDSKNKLFRRKPYSEGKFVKRNVKGQYRLNNEGWNSTRDYFKKKEKDTYRIACIGSSETGGYEVHVSEAFPKIIEDTINEAGVKCEVYTFAEDRAIGLSHALHLTRYAIKHFNPDIILYNGTFNGDLLVEATVKTHFTLVKVDSQGNCKLVPPRNESIPVLGKDFTLKSLFFKSRFIKYLRPRLAIRTRFYNARNMVLSSVKSKQIPIIKPIVADKKALSFSKKTELAWRFVLEEFHKLQNENATKILYIVMPIRDKSFNWRDENPERMLLQQKDRNAKIELLKKYAFPFYDMENIFTDDYAINGIKFDHLLDPHLNLHGHRVEGKAIANFLLNNNYFSNSKENNSLNKEQQVSAS
jgi:hypothetical protein